MFYSILVVITLEILAVSCFMLGYILGKGKQSTQSNTTRIEKVELNDINFDPVSPEDQTMMKKFEEEAKRNGFEEEEN